MWINRLREEGGRYLTEIVIFKYQHPLLIHVIYFPRNPINRGLHSCPNITLPKPDIKEQGAINSLLLCLLPTCSLLHSPEDGCPRPPCWLHIQVSTLSHPALILEFWGYSSLVSGEVTSYEKKSFPGNLLSFISHLSEFLELLLPQWLSHPRDGRTQFS